MIGSGAHPLDIGGAEALLTSGDPPPAGLRLSPKYVLELHHPGGGEKQGGIVWDKAGGGQAPVPVPLKIGKINFPQFTTVHETDFTDLGLSPQL